MDQTGFDRLEPTGLVVEISQIVVHEGDEPDALAHLTHPHLLAGKHLAEIYFPVLETDPAAVGDGGRPVV